MPPRAYPRSASPPHSRRAPARIDQQAYTLAVNDLFFLSGVFFVVLLVFIWAAQPAKSVAIDVAGAH